MKQKFIIQTILTFLLLVNFSSLLYSSDVEPLVNKLAEKGVLSYPEAQNIIVETQERSKFKLAKGEVDYLPLWIQNLSLRGDVRLRYQYDHEINRPERHRGRIRFRLTGETRIVNNVKADFGLATGVMRSVVTVTTTAVPTTYTGDTNDRDPRSTNVTFEDSLSKKLIFLDYASIEYEPKNWIRIVGGKMRNPLWQTTDLMWDTDLNPEGVAIFLNQKISDLDLSLVSLYMVIDEIGGSVLDPYMLAFQPRVSYKVLPWMDLRAGLVYYNFNCVENSTLDYSPGTNSLENRRLILSYTPTYSPSLELRVKDIPYINTINIFSDYVVNQSTNVNNQGYAVGLRLGSERITDFGDWAIRYMFRRLERDAFLDIFPDSDAYGGQTNTLGYEIIFEFGLTKNTTLVVDYYDTDRLVGATSTTPRKLLQVDITTRF